jgi:hypothetical protein
VVGKKGRILAATSPFSTKTTAARNIFFRPFLCDEVFL